MSEVIPCTPSECSGELEEWVQGTRWTRSAKWFDPKGLIFEVDWICPPIFGGNGLPLKSFKSKTSDKNIAVLSSIIHQGKCYSGWEGGKDSLRRLCVSAALHCFLQTPERNLESITSHRGGAKSLRYL